ncbi:MAG TPA: S9 family peptidase, partial [Candidatus Polarisedimenticolia bacterium]|nr:S9 family peptidase [Candidatus Polarisedimenticolia bacterium]
PAAIDDLARYRELSDIQASPDGRRVVLRIGSVDTTRDTYTADLYMLDLDGGGLTRLTTHPGAESHPRFSPDGSRLAFLARRDGRAQIYVLSMLGGEAAPLVSFDESILDFAWFPDGRRIVFAARTPKPKKEQDGGADDVLIITRTRFKLNGVGYLDGRRTQLYIADLETGAVRPLTDDDHDHRSPAVSADGRFVAFVSNLTPDPDTNHNSDVCAIPSTGGPLIRVSSEPGMAANPRWSPDGRWLAYLEQTTPDDWGADRQLFVAAAPRGGTFLPAFGEPRSLTSDLGLSVGEGAYGAGGDPYPIWSPDGRRLYAAFGDHARLHGYAIDPRGGRADLLIGGDRMVEFLTPSGDGRRLVFGLSDATHTSDVYVAALNGSGARRLTRLNDDWLGDVRVGVPERFVSRNTTDGWETEGWILRPPGAAVGTPLPTVLAIHGGPQWYYGVTYSFFFQAMAARGYQVVYTNPRGSTTYGQPFSDAVRGRYGLEDYQDLMAALDTVAARGLVDEANLFVTGYSYGGMMTDWIITRTDRFKAAASGAAIADYAAAVGPDDSFVDWIAEFGGPPWEVPDAYRSISPYTFVKNVTTPTLFLHGLDDMRCPVADSERMYLALRLLGVETRLALFPGENHDFDGR